MITDDALIQAALEVREHSYSPYSGFAVGAAIAFGEDQVAVGTNVENCSFGLTVCAERHAVAAAVASGCKPQEVSAIAIVADAQGTLSPCGACRQVLAEFAPASAKVIIYYIATQVREFMTVGELLPNAFDGSTLEGTPKAR